MGYEQQSYNDRPAPSDAVILERRLSSSAVAERFLSLVFSTSSSLKRFRVGRLHAAVLDDPTARSARPMYPSLASSSLCND